MSITLEDIKKQFAKYICLSDTDVIDVFLATIITNKMPGDSICLHLVGPSSSAKTEMIRTILEYPPTHHVTQISPRTLLSGFTDKAKPGENMSLLKKLEKGDKNLLVFKDFTTIISMSREDRSVFLSQLREMADGYLSADFGNDQRVEFKQHVGVITGCTNAIDEFGTVDGQLGERFLKYRLTADLADEIAELAMEVNNEKEILRTETAKMVIEYLNYFSILKDIPKWDDEWAARFRKLCVLCAHMRSPIIKDWKGIQVSTVSHEGPGRLVSQMDKLAKALAFVRQSPIVDLGVYRICKKILRDTMPPFRLNILHEFYEKGPQTVAELSDNLRVHWKTVAQYCGDLVSVSLIKFVNPEGRRMPGYATRNDKWEIEYKYLQMIEESQIFVVDKI